jgi:hypothetical protein
MPESFWAWAPVTVRRRTTIAAASFMGMAMWPSAEEDGKYLS